MMNRKGLSILHYYGPTECRPPVGGRLILAVIATVLVLATVVGCADTRRVAVGVTAITSLTKADGWTDDRPISVADDDEPVISKLEPRLLAAVRAAAVDARADGITIVVNSGWRSARYQQELLDDAVHRYGSLGEARRWVSTPTQSHHVTGKAVDIGPSAAASWLEQHGPHYGLCRAYSNEPWHYELLTVAAGTCPAVKADAAS